jgi:hypothetical protein
MKAEYSLAVQVTLAIPSLPCWERDRDCLNCEHGHCILDTCRRFWTCWIYSSKWCSSSAVVTEFLIKINTIQMYILQYKICCFYKCSAGETVSLSLTQTKNLYCKYSKTCSKQNRKEPNIFSTLAKFPHYTKLQLAVLVL